MDLFDSLTEKQLAVYEFIRDKIRNRGYGPTVREIGGNFNISSPNGVVCHLKALEKKGMITREPNMSRAIQLAAEPIEDRSLPLSGQIAAGVLHEAVEQGERVDFKRFSIRPTKPSCPGGPRRIDDRGPDCRRRLRGRPPPTDRPKGQIVVAITDEGEATLKRWFRKRTASAWSRPIRA